MSNEEARSRGAIHEAITTVEASQQRREDAGAFDGGYQVRIQCSRCRAAINLHGNRIWSRVEDGLVTLGIDAQPHGLSCPQCGKLHTIMWALHVEQIADIRQNLGIPSETAFGRNGRIHLEEPRGPTHG